MVYSEYTKLRILHYQGKGYKPYTISYLLKKEDGISASRYGIAKFLAVYFSTDSISRRPGSGRASKITARVKEIVENQMQLDDETTAHQLHRLLTENGVEISLRTILRCRTSLGWTFRGSAYCQLIREANKKKRLDWTLQHMDDTFEDVLYTDECTVQLENHRRFCCRKHGQRPKPKPNPKHPVKVHVWAGISKQGRSQICIFEGIMDRYLYVDILKETLLPSVQIVSWGPSFHAG